MILSLIEVLGLSFPSLSIPLIEILVFFVNIGSKQAIPVLSKIATIRDSDKFVQSVILQIQGIHRKEGIQGLWEYWYASRNDRLSRLLISAGLIPDPSSPLVAYAWILKGEMNKITEIPPQLLPALIQASNDSNHQIAEFAQKGLSHLRHRGTIKAFCTYWLETRNPLAEKILVSSRYLPDPSQKGYIFVALKTNRLTNVMDALPEHAEELIQACTEPDSEIRERGLSSLSFLRNPETIHRLFELWWEKRFSCLEEWILRGVFLPKPGTPVWLAVNLKRHRDILPEEIPLDLVNTLVLLCYDQDSEIQTKARELISKLTSQHINRLAELAMQGEQKALDLWQEYHLTSSKPEIQACMLLLTEQLEAYFQFDYDLRLMQVFYQTTTPEIRSRITRLIQRLGHPSLVKILAVHEIRKELQSFQPEVIETAIRIYTEHQRLDELWTLVFQVPAKYGIRILRDLFRQEEWKPSKEDELFYELRKEFYEFQVEDISNIQEKIPPLIHLATVRVGGRVNDFAVIPQSHLIAIATSNQQVILWDYQQAKIQKRIKGFSHSLARIIALSENGLIVAERSTGSTPCGIYAIKQHHQIEKIGEHPNAIVGLFPLNANRYVSVYKNGEVYIGDLTTYPSTPQYIVPFPPKAVAIDASQQKVAFIQEKYPYLLDLHTLKSVHGEYNQITRQIDRNVASYMTFSQSGDALLVGKRFGDVILYPRTSKTQLVGNITFPVIFIGFIPGIEKYLAIARNGNILWLDTQYNLSNINMKKIPEEDITSVEIFDDGQFMVIGHAHRLFTFWDLRSNFFHRWLEQPLSSLTIEDLLTIRSFRLNPHQPLPLKWLLTFLDLILTHRYQYDIFIAEPVTIKPGEFDILIENNSD